MEAGVRLYQGPYNNDWTGFDQDYHQVIFFDEFKGQLPIQQLNELCNTFTRLNCKFGGISKTRRVLVVVASNYSIDECYAKAVDQRADITETVHARFREKRFHGKVINEPIIYEERIEIDENPEPLNIDFKGMFE